MRKRLVFFVALLMLGGAAWAQEPAERSGETYAEQPQPQAAQQKGIGAYNSKNLDDILPKSGDLALGLDASPILNYLGNMFNNSQNNDPKTYLNTTSPVVYMRYYLSSNLAIRARAQWSGTKGVYTFEVDDQAALAKDPLSRAKVEDRQVVRHNSWKFGAGAQYFRGYGRLRGFVGGDFDYKVGRSVTRYYYGNKMTKDNKAPLTFRRMHEKQRSLVQDGGWMHHIGAAGFVGVEYYFLPKMCLGIETGVSMSAELRGKSTYRYEHFVGDTYHDDWVDTFDHNPEVEFSVETTKPGDIIYANFYFMFHF